MNQIHHDQHLSVWDEPAALNSVGGNRALALNLLRELCATLPDEMRALRERATQDDLRGAAERAHYINSGAAYCGVLALRSQLKQLEIRARAGDNTGVHIALNALETEAHRLLAFASGLG